MSEPRVRAEVTAAAGAAAIAFSAILVRVADVSPSTAAFFRCLYALPWLALLVVVARRRGVRRTASERRTALLAGVLIGVELVLWHHAIDNVGAGLATVVANLQVVFVALAAWAFLAERPGRRMLVALPLVVLGALLISGALEQDAYGANPGLGAVFAVGAAAIYAAFLLVYRRAGASGDLAGPLFDVSLAAAAAAGLLGLLSGELDLQPGWPAQGWLLLLAVTSQVLGYLLVGIALPQLPAAVGAMLLMVQPVMSVILAGLLLGESPSALQLAGVAVVLGAVLLAATASRKT